MESDGLESYLPNEVTTTDLISSGSIPLLALHVYRPCFSDVIFLTTNECPSWRNAWSLYHVIVGLGPP